MKKQPNETTEQFNERRQIKLVAVKAKKADSRNPKKNRALNQSKPLRGIFSPWYLESKNGGKCKAPSVDPERGNHSQIAVSNSLFLRAKFVQRNGHYPEN